MILGSIQKVHRLTEMPMQILLITAVAPQLSHWTHGSPLFFFVVIKRVVLEENTIIHYWRSSRFNTTFL